MRSHSPFAARLRLHLNCGAGLRWMLPWLALLLAACATPAPTQSGLQAVTEVRGTWLTTTANQAIASPADTERSMRELRAIGLNTVYVESWKNGYANYPSQVLRRVIGIESRPASQKADPADKGEGPGRDLLQEAVIEAHRNGLIAVAWFEYGFMAAHQSTMNHLRRMKPEWLSRDANGGEVAPNGFVWMNPLHPEARQFLLDLVLEAVERYDLDGVQLDDRIVWPYVTMGYDAYTRAAYAAEHGGRQPPENPRDPGWMRWRAGKVDEFARLFTQELKARRPGLLVSLSPAVYPWSWDHYLLEWPKWAAWSDKDRVVASNPAASQVRPRWDEFIPQAYRNNYPAFERTWLEQVQAVRELGGNRQRDLLAGIRIQGEGPDASWDDLQKSILLVRKQGNGGHVLWFSRGVLERYAAELTRFYEGWVPSPRFPQNWREPSIALFRSLTAGTHAEAAWERGDIPRGRYHLIAHDGKSWTVLREVEVERDTGARGRTVYFVPHGYSRVELLVDRRDQQRRAPAR